MDKDYSDEVRRIVREEIQKILDRNIVERVIKMHAKGIIYEYLQDKAQAEVVDFLYKIIKDSLYVTIEAKVKKPKKK